MRMILALLALLAAGPAFAQDARAVDLSALPEVRAAEAYMNGLATVSARFTQTDNSGQQLSGDFLLKRPGRLRFQYDAPVTDFIVADGLFIYYYDGKLKQQSNAPISQSLADFFLRKQISFKGDVAVSDVRRDGGFLRITLTQAKDKLAGSLTLFFNENPLLLDKWRIVDAQGAVTEVALSQMQSGITLDNDAFRYHDPARAQPKYN